MDGEFLRCEALESIVFHDNLELIGPQALAGSPALKSVTLPGKLRAIGEMVFIG